MVNIIQTRQLCFFACRNTRDPQTVAILERSPLWVTNQDRQLKTLQRPTMTSLIILRLCLTNRLSRLKGQTVAEDTTQTNTHTYVPNSLHSPPTPRRKNKTKKHTHTHRAHTPLRDKHKRVLKSHTRISPLLCLSLPDETNRTLIQKMEGKNALVCNH